MISPTRHLPNARKDQWSFDIQRELCAGHLARPAVCRLAHAAPGSELLQQHAAARCRARSIRGGRARSSRAGASSQNDLIADYDAVSIILRKRMRHGLQADAHYTWSKTRDMGTHSNGGGQTMNNYDIWADYGPADWDIPHRFVASYIYDVPFLKSSSQPILKYVVAGWQIGGVTTIQSGTPINVTLSGDPANIGISNLQRPNLVGTVPSLNCQPLAEQPRAGQLLRCVGVPAARGVHVRQRPAQPVAGPQVGRHRPVADEELPDRRRRAVPVPRRDLQRVQQRQLWQPERARSEPPTSAASAPPEACVRFSWVGRSSSDRSQGQGRREKAKRSFPFPLYLKEKPCPQIPVENF